MNKPTKSNSYASELGRSGGKANVKKHGKAHMKALAKSGAEARWGNKKSKK